MPNKDSQFDNAQLMMTGRTPNDVKKDGGDVTPNTRDKDIICSEFDPIMNGAGGSSARGLRNATSNVKVGPLNTGCDDKKVNNFMQTQQIIGVASEDVQLRSKKPEGSGQNSPDKSPNAGTDGLALASKQHRLNR